jgi:hypothetical protein
LRGVALRGRNDTMIFADPDSDAGPIYAEPHVIVRVGPRR